jgi:hypothetical protein
MAKSLISRLLLENSNNQEEESLEDQIKEAGLDINDNILFIL